MLAVLLDDEALDGARARLEQAGFGPDRYDVLEAEPEHQDYLQRIPNGYTCHFPRPGWKLPHRETAA